MSNKTITKLAETMNAEAFINELDARKIDYELDNVDNLMDYNDGMMNVVVGESTILFVDGELDTISY
jgi:hypothetical protein